MNTTEALGWLGAVTGIVGTATGVSSLGVSYWSIRRDRPQLVAMLQHGFKVSENVGDYRTEYTYILIKVSNRGRWPTAIAKIWLTQCDSTKSLLVKDALRAEAAELPAGQTKNYLAREERGDAVRLKNLYVEDGAGRKWVGSANDERWVTLRLWRG